MTGSEVWLHKQRTAILACAGVPDVANLNHSGTRRSDTNSGNTSPEIQITSHLFLCFQHKKQTSNWGTIPFHPHVFVSRGT